MALSTKQGSFSSGTATGSKAITGVGFQPKALILWANNRSAGGADGVTTSVSNNDDMPTAFAIAAGTSIASIGDGDNFVAGDYGIDQTHLNVWLSGAAGSQKLLATLTSLDSDGFTLNLTTAPATAITIYYLALGGSDITGATILAGNLATATGNQAFTTVGFKPDAVIFLGGDLASTGGNWDGRAGFGMFTSTTQRNTVSSGTNSGSGFGVGSYERTAKAFNVMSGQTMFWEADLVSMDSDGFTLNFTTATGGTPKMAALCLKGPQMIAGADTSRTTTGTKATTGLGFQPQALVFMSAGKAPSTSIDVNWSGIGFGGTDGTNQGSICLGDNGSGVAYRSSSKAIGLVNAFSSSGVLLAEAGISSLDSSGFTLNWTTADSTAREFLYMAFGPAPSPGQGTPFQPHRMPLGV